MKRLLLNCLMCLILVIPGVALAGHHEDGDKSQQSSMKADSDKCDCKNKNPNEMSSEAKDYTDILPNGGGPESPF